MRKRAIKNISSALVMPNTKFIIRWLLIPILLYACALVPRAYKIEERVIQPDERHWVTRSNIFLDNIKQGNYSEATSHFSQPGLVPGLFMAASQKIASAYNESKGYKLFEPGYVDRLIASRYAVAVVASLIAPVLFLGIVPYLGVFISFLASLLVAWDPFHISYSRIAHLDAILSVFVALTFYSYLRADTKRSVSWKVIAGILWGFCLACKPTAVGLVVSFLAYKVIRATGLLKDSCRKGQYIEWSDVWAVIVAHMTFSLLYTRFWHTNSPYVWRLNIHSQFADGVYAFGMWMHQTPAIAWLLGVGLLLLGASAIRDYRCGVEKTRVFVHGRILGCILLLFLFAHALFPPVLENIIRYWMWAIGLSKHVHESYGIKWSPPPYGYWGIYFRDIPSFIFIGFALTVIPIFSWIINGSHRTSDRKFRFLTFLFLMAVVWTSILSVSSSQTIRYVLPVTGFIYVCSIFTWRKSLDYAAEKLNFKVVSKPAFLFCFLFIIQFANLFFHFPHYGLFRSAISGGLDRAMAAKETVHPIGLRAAVEFLHAEAVKKKEPQFVMVLGDGSVVNYTYKNHYRKPDA